MFDTTPPHRRHRLLVCQTHQPLFGASFRKYVSQSVGDLASEARTRPAPGPRQGFFSDVTQFDLTDFAGQKRDLRTMEPVAGEIGHCFVVGARHQLRASMSAGWRGSAGQVRRNFRQLSPHRTTMPGRNVMLESTSGTCAFEVPRTGNRHQPFFGGCPRGVRN